MPQKSAISLLLPRLFGRQLKSNVRNSETQVLNELKTRHKELLDGLLYAMHELPAGVLFGPNSANTEECAELLSYLNEFETLCQGMGQNQELFVANCRWHLDHYPHYLRRRAHFASYAQYIEDRKGPLTVQSALA